MSEPRSEKGPLCEGPCVHCGAGPDEPCVDELCPCYEPEPGCEVTPPIGMDNHRCVLRGPHHFHEWEVTDGQ